MIDHEKLERRPLSKLVTVEYFICQHCLHEEVMLFTTLQLQESMQKLERMSPAHKSFPYFFLKTLKRAQVIQLRGQEYLKQNGTIRYSNLVVT